ncbi:MAG: hypothetical protein JXX14_11835 [Deltaproteobacteria bacterium]|nr:hypothetical protein [Deltaproteobacteria bacterium]
MKCYESKLKLIGLMGLGLLLIAGSVFCTMLPNWTAQIAGWVGAVFFSLCFIAIPMRFFRKGPQVIIDENGIEDKRLKIGVIEWRHIDRISEGDIHGTKFLCLHLTDPEIYLQKLPTWKRRLTKSNNAVGFPEFSLSFVGLSPGYTEVRAFVSDQINS